VVKSVEFKLWKGKSCKFQCKITTFNFLVSLKSALRAYYVKKKKRPNILFVCMWTNNHSIIYMSNYYLFNSLQINLLNNCVGWDLIFNGDKLKNLQ